MEVVRILNGIPAAGAIRILRLLSSETNAPIILSTLRDEATARKEASSVSSGMSTARKDSPTPFEFEVHNRTAYPALAHVDGSNLEKQPSTEHLRLELRDKFSSL